MLALTMTCDQCGLAKTFHLPNCSRQAQRDVADAVACLWSPAGDDEALVRHYCTTECFLAARTAGLVLDSERAVLFPKNPITLIVCATP